MLIKYLTFKYLMKIEYHFFVKIQSIAYHMLIFTDIDL